MNSTMKRILLVLISLSFVGFTLSNALAQDEAEGEEGAEAEAEAEAEEDADEGLSEEAADYVGLAGDVACYNKRVSDGAKAKKAIEHYLKNEGLTLEEYQAMEKKFRGDSAVQDAIKAEMDLCATKVLAMPEGDEEAIEEAEEDDKPKWTYRKKVYQGRVSGGGVSGGRIMFAFQRNGKTAKGNVTGNIRGGNFAVGLRGKRRGNHVTLRGSSGKKNSLTASIKFKKRRDSKDFVHYSKASGSVSGKINGKRVRMSVSAKSDKH